MSGSSFNRGEADLRSHGWSSRGWSKWLGIAFPLVLLLLLFFSRAINTGFVYYPPLLFSALNIVFVVLISLVVAYLAARGYLATGQSQLVWLGGGALAFGFSALLTAVTQTQLNAAVTLHNTGAFLAGLIYTVGAVMGVSGDSPLQQGKAKAYVLTGIYAIGAVFMLQVMLLSLAGITPTFFVPGTGGTPLRQAVLYSGTGLFGLSGILLLLAHFRTRSVFMFWYSLGLILTALGLLTVSFVKTPGDFFAWLGRGGQYFAGIYLIIAVVSLVREARAQRKPLEELIAEFGQQARVNYELLVSSASDAIIAVDGLGRILMWNPAAEKMFGNSSSEAVGLPFFDFLSSPGQISSYKKASNAVGPGEGQPGTGITTELKARRRNGEEFPVEVTLASRELAGKWLFTTLIIRDISERKKMEMMLKESEERFFKAFHLSPVPITIAHLPQGRWIDVNNSFLSMMEYSREEVIGHTSVELNMFPEPGKRTQTLKSFLEKGILQNREMTVRTKSGKLLTVLSSNEIISLNGQDHAVSTIIDITERKKAEELVRFQSLLVDSTTEAIISAVLTPGGQFITRTWNKGAEKLYGWKAEEVIGRPTMDFLQPEFQGPGTPEEYIKSFLEQGSWSGEITNRRKDGSRVVVLVSNTVLRDEGGHITGAVGVHHDITELKKAERLKDEFVGMVSHELRTPITVMMGALYTLEDKRLPEEDRRQLLDDSIRSTEALASIVENLLELSRSQANRLVLKPEDMDLGEIARLVVNKLQKISVIHRLRVELPAGLLAVRADPVKVERVLYNLVENAIKYSPGGGEVRIFATDGDECLTVGVSDEGQGISQDNQKRLFQSFEQLGISNRSSMQGVGLGLKVCRILVEAHNGQIWVESEPGKGSTFFFTLPLAGQSS